MKSSASLFSNNELFKANGSPKMKGNMSPGKEAVTADGVSVSDWRASFDQSETGEKADMFKGVKLHKVGENHTTDGYIVTDENIKVTFLTFNLIELELFIFASFNTLWYQKATYT